jgi:hypothetical protein
MHDYLQPADIAKLLAVSPKKVRSWCRSGQLRAANLNDNRRPRWVILRADLDEFLRTRQPEPKQPSSRRAGIQRLPTDRY